MIKFQTSYQMYTALGKLNNRNGKQFVDFACFYTWRAIYNYFSPPGEKLDESGNVAPAGTNRPAEQEKVDAYLDTVARLEPSIAMIDRDAALASIAISLRRIADTLDRASGYVDFKRALGG